MKGPSGQPWRQWSFLWASGSQQEQLLFKCTPNTLPLERSFLEVRRHFDFSFPLKGVSGADGGMAGHLQGPGSEAIDLFHMCNQTAIWVLVQILLKRLKSVVLNAVPNLGVKHSLENIHVLIAATFGKKE